MITLCSECVPLAWNTSVQWRKLNWTRIHDQVLSGSIKTWQPHGEGMKESGQLQSFGAHLALHIVHFTSPLQFCGNSWKEWLGCVLSWALWQLYYCRRSSSLFKVENGERALFHHVPSGSWWCSRASRLINTFCSLCFTRPSSRWRTHVLEHIWKSPVIKAQWCVQHVRSGSSSTPPNTRILKVLKQTRQKKPSLCSRSFVYARTQSTFWISICADWHPNTYQGRQETSECFVSEGVNPTTVNTAICTCTTCYIHIFMEHSLSTATRYRRQSSSINFSKPHSFPIERTSSHKEALYRTLVLVHMVI